MEKLHEKSSWKIAWNFMIFFMKKDSVKYFMKFNQLAFHEISWNIS
jgi:hypothetical protein